MINTKFELYKFKRELRRYGKTYIVYRNSVNEFKERVKGDYIQVTEITGIYHESNNYIKQNISEGSVINVKKIPMLLVESEKVNNIKINDMIFINDIEYRVTGITNIQNWNILSDISLEVANYDKH